MAEGSVLLAVVALRKESVDRNIKNLPEASLPSKSLSARRAWIEIRQQPAGEKQRTSLSARRAWIEICGGAFAKPLAVWSLSARRAWIEIGVDFAEDWLDAVALRKESVDRNSISRNGPPGRLRRSPQGERG